MKLSRADTNYINIYIHTLLKLKPNDEKLRLFAISTCITAGFHARHTSVEDWSRHIINLIIPNDKEAFALMLNQVEIKIRDEKDDYYKRRLTESFIKKGRSQFGVNRILDYLNQEGIRNGYTLAWKILQQIMLNQNAAFWAKDSSLYWTNGFNIKQFTFYPDIVVAEFLPKNLAKMLFLPASKMSDLLPSKYNSQNDGSLDNEKKLIEFFDEEIFLEYCDNYLNKSGSIDYNKFINLYIKWQKYCPNALDLILTKIKYSTLGWCFKLAGMLDVAERIFESSIVSPQDECEVVQNRIEFIHYLISCQTREKLLRALDELTLLLECKGSYYFKIRYIKDLKSCYEEGIQRLVEKSKYDLNVSFDLVFYFQIICHLHLRLEDSQAKIENALNSLHAQYSSSELISILKQKNLSIELTPIEFSDTHHTRKAHLI